MAKRLSAPTMAVWVITLVVGGIGILNHLRVLHLRLGVEDMKLDLIHFDQMSWWPEPSSC